VAIAPTKKQREKVIELLDAYVEDHDKVDEAGEPLVSAEDAASALLELTWDLYEQRAKFTVVGQLRYSKGEFLDPEDARASKVALGRYATETQAKDHAESLVFSHQTGEEMRVWVLPVHHGTPHEWFRARATDRKEEALANSTPRERELYRRIEWFKANPDALTYAPQDPDVEPECDCDCCDHREETERAS